MRPAHRHVGTARGPAEAGAAYPDARAGTDDFGNAGEGRRQVPLPSAAMAPLDILRVLPR
eukprot:1931534-Lingulodinium_polyedra.AAC.1